MKKNDLPNINKTGFKVPDNYFGDFEARMMDLVNIKGDDKISSPNPFKVPEGYFNSFEERVTKRLNEEEKQPKVISLLTNRYFSYAAGFAAVIAVIFSLQFFDRSRSTGYEDLEITAVENYLLEKLDLTTPEESHLIKEDDFSFATPVTADLNQEAVFEYLNENTEDPSLLLNDN